MTVPRGAELRRGVAGGHVEHARGVADVEAAEAEDGQADDGHAHHGATAEGDVERLGETVPRGRGGADVRVGGHSHAGPASDAGEDGTDDEAERDQGAATFAAVVRPSEEGCDDRHEDGEHLVLGLQERHRALSLIHI